ncbi:MAG TPA: recombinase family protein, partial [Symbiobacteriaceae bacterium]|nr:recombinase family protein [Symbiobacteriaceae bacterium]
MSTSTKIEADRVAAYIRWSTDDQSDGTTLDVQKESCMHYIKSQGWQFREDLCFIDDGYSGGTLDRPAMTALRQAVKAGNIQCVVVYKLDRL